MNKRSPSAHWDSSVVSQAWGSRAAQRTAPGSRRQQDHTGHCGEQGPMMTGFHQRKVLETVIGRECFLPKKGSVGAGL